MDEKGRKIINLAYWIYGLDRINRDVKIFGYTRKDLLKMIRDGADVPDRVNTKVRIDLLFANVTPEKIDPTRVSFLYIAKEIRRRRLRKRLTQEKLAKKVGVTKRMVIYYEKGTHPPTKWKFQKIKKVLGLKLKKEDIETLVSFEYQIKARALP